MLSERLKNLRKALNLTQQQMANDLNLKRSTIATYEIGKGTPGERTINDICTRYNVSEDWIKFGTGEMFETITHNEAISDFMVDLIKEDDNDFKKKFIKALSKLSKEQWKLLEDLSNEIINRD